MHIFIYFRIILGSTMVSTHIKQLPPEKTYVYIPSFLREDFKITKESLIDITKENGKIVITITNAGDNK